MAAGAKNEVGMLVVVT